MSTAHFRFSPSILRRLGEELNPHPDQGILELVKNAYDADARNCVVEISAADGSSAAVRVIDDGVGMDEATIRDGWLLLGESAKTIAQPTTRLGRLPVGNKGLGRLAALRMGNLAALVTRPEVAPKDQLKVQLDWEEFDRAKAVEEVPIQIVRSKRAPDAKPGTEIAVRGLRTRIGRMDVKRLARGLLLLADPFGDDPVGFHPRLRAPEFADLEKLVQRRYFDDAEFHLTAILGESGKASASVTDWKGNLLYKASQEELRPRATSKPYSCPAARFDLWVFILERERFMLRSTSVQEIREWLAEFGGVHLYIRGIRVTPYGNPGNDWLDLNLSRVRSPELRPSTNTAIGRIALSDPAERLRQKTDRSGLIEDETFDELRRFATDALDWMARRRKAERERLRVAERTRAPRQVARAKQTTSDVIAKLPPRYRKSASEAFEAYDRSRDQESAALRKEVQLYRTLATAGITAAVFAHESRHPVRLLSQNAKLVERRAKNVLKTKYAALLASPMGRILRQVTALQAFSNLALGMIDHEKRRTGRVDIHDSIKTVLAMFQLYVGERDAVVTPELAPGEPFLRGTRAAIESIVINLLTNSLRAFEEAGTQSRRVIIRTKVVASFLQLSFIDSGPGLQGLSAADIWLPGETTYANGTGLGLAIVRDTIEDLGGNVDAKKQGELGGAQIELQFPILGS